MQPATTTMSPAPTMMSPGTYTVGTQPVATYATPMANTPYTYNSYPVRMRGGLFGMRTPVYSYPPMPATTTYATPAQTYTVMPGQTYYQPVRRRMGLFQRWRQQATPAYGGHLWYARVIPNPVYHLRLPAPVYTTYGYNTPAYYTTTYASPAATLPASSVPRPPVVQPVLLSIRRRRSTFPTGRALEHGTRDNGPSRASIAGHDTGSDGASPARSRGDGTDAARCQDQPRRSARSDPRIVRRRPTVVRWASPRLIEPSPPFGTRSTASQA